MKKRANCVALIMSVKNAHVVADVLVLLPVNVRMHAMARLVAQMHERLERLKPAWLLLDEPTAALDVDQQHRLMARLRRYADRGCGVILVLHDLAVAALYADIVLVLEAGKLVEQGPPADVLAPEAVMRRFGIDVGAVQLGGRGHSLYPHPHPVA